MRTLLALLLAAFVALPAFAAEDKKADAKKLLGTWTREANNIKITMEFKKDTMKVTLEPPNEKIIVDADYKLDAKGVLTGTVKKTEGGGPAEGDEFTFKVEVGEKTFTLSELKVTKGTDPGPEAKQAIEGEYKKGKAAN